MYALLSFLTDYFKKRLDPIPVMGKWIEYRRQRRINRFENLYAPLRNCLMAVNVEISNTSTYISSGYLPFDEIEEIIRSNVKYADAKLLDLLQRAKQAQIECYETRAEDDVHSEKSRLLSYIDSEYRKLAKRCT
jgi:hypothetical protein